MKKFYNSADLCTTIMRSEYTNSDNSFFYNTFVPISTNNNEEAIQSIKHIKFEIKKISDEDMKKNNLNILAPSLLNSQLYVTKLMNVQTSEQLIINFLEYDFTSFSNYFSFFLDFGFLSIVSPVKSSDIAMFRALSITTLNELLALAYKYYEKDKNNLISYQEEYKKIINFIFNLDNDKNLNDLSPHNLLFLYEILNEPESSIFKYRVNINITENMLQIYDLLSINPDYVKATRKDTKTLIKQLKELSNNNTIKLEYGKIYKFSSVFELFYLHLLFLVSNNSNYIKKCKCCGKYFYTNKVNVTYCDRIQNEKNGQTCKDIGADIVALREKKKDYLVNLKASIASKKAMDVKRHPDIPEYKENYKNWKPLALEYLKKYKNGALDAKAFEKWLKYTSNEKIKSKLKTIDEFKDL